MAFQVPVQQPLTGVQNEALAKLSSMNNLLSLPFKNFFDKPKSQQISLLDFLTKIADAVFGAGYIDTLILKFVNDLFDRKSLQLEKAIIKALAEAFDAKPITIKAGQTNKQWLETNVQPELHIGMEVLKALLIKKIMILIYGPKQRMTKMSMPPGTYNNFYLPDDGNFNDLDPNQQLDNASLSDTMFTTVNVESNSFGDAEMNIVKLKKQLEKGQVTFTVSCQDVKINLPEAILQSSQDLIEDNIRTFTGKNIPGGQKTYQNPTKVLVELTGHVENETQRINNEENATAVRKSWLRILLDKIINLLPIALYPILNRILAKVNTSIQNDTGVNPNLTVENTLGLAIALKNDYSDENLFNKNSTFYRIMMNGIYALALSFILKKMIPKITKLITKALAKKRANDLQRKFKRQIARAKLIAQKAEEVSKKAQAVRALAQLKPAIDYLA